MWIMCQNQGELTERGIRLLGESRKKAGAIGKFGTGLKEAIVLSCRLGIEMVIMMGTTRVEIMVDDSEIIYVIDGRIVRSNIHQDFGKHDWADPWQIFREVFCNAQDEGGLYHEVVPTIEGVAGSTRVFLKGSASLFEHYGCVDRRLRFNMTDGPSDRVDSVGRIYHKGVWVSNITGSSIWDWNLPGLKLTESRTASEYDIHNEVQEYLCGADERIIIQLLSASDEEMEWKACTGVWCAEQPSKFDNAARQLWGDKYCLCPNDASVVAAIMDKKLKPVMCSEKRLSFLVKMGCIEYRGALKATGDDLEIKKSVEPYWLDRLWSIIGDGRDEPKIVLYNSSICEGTFIRDSIIYTDAPDSGAVIERVVDSSPYNLREALAAILSE